MSRQTLTRGSIIRVDFDPTKGREQRGRRPALVVSSPGYLASVPDLVIVLPITSVDRGWPHHVLVEGEDVTLQKPSFAMTEQPRTVSRSRVGREAGVAGVTTMTEVDHWLRDFVGL